MFLSNIFSLLFHRKYWLDIWLNYITLVTVNDIALDYSSEVILSKLEFSWPCGRGWFWFHRKSSLESSKITPSYFLPSVSVHLSILGRPDRFHSSVLKPPCFITHCTSLMTHIVVSWSNFFIAYHLKKRSSHGKILQYF